MKRNWFYAGISALLAACFFSMGCGKGGEGGGTAAALTFQNPNTVDVGLVLSGGFDGQFRVPAGESVTIAPRPGEATTIRIQMDPAPEAPPVATVGTVEGRKSSPVPIDVPLVAGESAARINPACIRFINQAQVPVLVETPFGAFEVAPKSDTSREIPPDTEAEIKYRPAWNEGDYEEPPPKKIKAPVAGRTNDVMLTLVRKEDSEVNLPAWIEFRNAGLETIRVKPIGSWDAGEFDIKPNGKVPKPCKPGGTLEYEYWTPFSDEYNRGTNTVTALEVGGTIKYETITPIRVVSQAVDATLTLVNPNDVDIMVDLSGGASGTRKVRQGGVPEEIPIEAGMNTVVRYFTADPRYQEYGRGNACTATVSGSTNLSLVLHPKPAPVLTVKNDGEVPLLVSIKSAGDGRVLGRSGTIEAHKAVVFRNLPAGEELNLVYMVENPHYRGGTKHLLGLDWGENSSETVRAVLQNQPAMEIRNTGYRTMQVTISRNGIPVEEPFMLEGKSHRVLAFAEAGEYRVQTDAVIGREDPSGRKEDYNSTDRTVACEWGGEPVVVDCDANEKPNSEYLPAMTEQDRAIQGALKAAARSLEGPWSVHGGVAAIANVSQYLMAAKRYGNGTDVDAIVEDVPGVLAFGDWKTAVENKQKSAVEDKDHAVTDDERWQHIVDTTRRSGNWNEFLVNY